MYVFFGLEIAWLLCYRFVSSKRSDVFSNVIITEFVDANSIQISKNISTIRKPVNNGFYCLHFNFESHLSPILPTKKLKLRFNGSLFVFRCLVEELITLIENVADSVSIGHCNPDSMALLLSNLRVLGPQLEEYSKSTLDQGMRKCSDLSTHFYAIDI